MIYSAQQLLLSQSSTKGTMVPMSPVSVLGLGCHTNKCTSVKFCGITTKLLELDLFGFGHKPPTLLSLLPRPHRSPPVSLA